MEKEMKEEKARFCFLKVLEATGALEFMQGQRSDDYSDLLLEKIGNGCVRLLDDGFEIGEFDLVNGEMHIKVDYGSYEKEDAQEFLAKGCLESGAIDVFIDHDYDRDIKRSHNEGWLDESSAIRICLVKYLEDEYELVEEIRFLRSIFYFS